MKNQELIKEVFSIIADQLSKNTAAANLSLHIEPVDEGVTLYLEYKDEASRELIHTMRNEVIAAGIYFDSGFLIQEPMIEWNLDWSLEKNC